MSYHSYETLSGYGLPLASQTQGAALGCTVEPLRGSQHLVKDTDSSSSAW